MIAELYLKTIHKKVRQVPLEDSHLGYDIEADENKIEVKTSTSISTRFFISITELKVAHEFPDNYYLFYIYVNKIKKEVYGYLINNPIKNLELDYANMTTTFTTELSSATPTNFCINVRHETMNSFIKIDLSNYVC